jgi:hypothetical protein
MKIRVVDQDSEEIFIGTIPIIPKKGEMIGFWTNSVDRPNEQEWHLCEINHIVYEFDKNNNFESIEITVEI